ncbi:FxsA family protein [Salinibius halmophilus]|uniref:FxsA family protein n=1 Tax=Salinibius halmophilus TaxID=1853216 RepID=UPI000E666087|nr:FxsA family protein [Salinibius halmophilus]
MPVLMVPVMLYFLIEIFLLFAMASWFGFLGTAVLFFGSSFLGGALLRREAARAPETWLQDVQRLGVKAASNSRLFPVIGGLLLTLPGFLTDIIGLVMWARGSLLKVNSSGPIYDEPPMGEPGSQRPDDAPQRPRQGHTLEGEYERED